MTEDKEVLYRVLSDYFVAGIIAKGNTVIDSAPIIKYSKDLGLEKFLLYCKKKKWVVEIVKEQEI
jgi:hypothetical protein